MLGRLGLPAGSWFKTGVEGRNVTSIRLPKLAKHVAVVCATNAADAAKHTMRHAFTNLVLPHVVLSNLQCLVGLPILL